MEKWKTVEIAVDANPSPADDGLGYGLAMGVAMAELAAVRTKLAPADARQTGSKSSWAEATLYCEGHAPIYVTADVSSGQVPTTDSGDGMKYISVGSLLEHPDIADIVTDNEKAGLAARRDRGELVKGTFRMRGSYEWDSLVFRLDADEKAQLSAVFDADPNMKARFEEIVADGFRHDPEGLRGKRMALVQPLHTDTNVWHVQCLVHRHALDLSAAPGYVGNGVEQDRDSALTKMFHRMIEELKKEFPFIKSHSVENDGRKVTEEKSARDTIKKDVAETLEKAGGVAPPRLDTAIEAGRPAADRLLSLSVEEKELDDLEQYSVTAAIKAARAEEEAREQKEMHSANAVLAQKAKAAILQKTQAEAEREAAVSARAEAEERATAAETARVEADERAKVNEARARAEADARARAEERAEHAEETAAKQARTITDLSGERDTLRRDLAAAQEHAARQAGQIEDLTGQVADLKREAAGEAERTADAVAAATAPLAERLAELERGLQAEREAREAAVAELAEERRSFPERLAAAVSERLAEARQAWDREIAAPLRREAEEARERLAEVREELREARATIAAAPAAMAEAIGKALADARDRFDRELASVREGYESRIQRLEDRVSSLVSAAREAAARPIQAAADAVRGAPTAAPAATPAVPAAAGSASAPAVDFRTAPPSEWTPEQRAAATAALDRMHAAGKLKTITSVEEYGERLHKQWAEKNPEAARRAAEEGPAPGATPEPKPKK